MKIITDFLLEQDIPFLENVELSKLTWLRRGGMANILVMPCDSKQLELICKFLYGNGIKFDLFGHTSNLYIHNSYNSSIIVSTKKCKSFKEYDNYIWCEAGAHVSTIARYFVDNGYSGMEYLTNLPGTIGGAIYNNSSCKKSVVSDLLIEAGVLLNNGSFEIWSNNDFHFSFRKSIFKSGIKEGIILFVKLKKEKSNRLLLKQISIDNEKDRRVNILNPSKTLGSTFSSQYDNGKMSLKYRIPWAIYNHMLNLFVKDSISRRKLSKSFLLFITGYRDLNTYISDNTYITYQWLDSKADEKFIRYKKFMKDIMKTTNIEIEEKKGTEEVVNLLTIHWGYSFGAVLQTYATSKILSSLGKKVNVINLVNHDSDFKYKQWRSYFNLINVYKFYSFKHRYFPNLTTKMYFIDSDKIPKANYTVVGSDQVWNRAITKENSLSFFLNFASNIKFSFASSFGVEQWVEDSQYTELIKEYLKQFTYLSVRESSAVKICMESFGVKSEQIIDPTLIWGEFEDLIPNKKSLNQIFPFFLHRSADKNLIVSFVAKQTGLAIFKYNMFTLRLFRGPLDWLSRMYNSEFIITDSFHGVAFSILFRKKFIVLCSEPQKFTRITSLLEMLNLYDRYVKSYDDLLNRWDTLSANIDFNYANKILEEQRKKAKIYLRKVFG